MEYYVYLLLDPRKFYSPFYVGKGKGSRWQDHIRENARAGKNSFKESVITKIKASGQKVGVLVWSENMTEDQAFELEKDLIKRFGRRNSKGGLLTNLTDGGEGCSGYVITKAHREKIKQRMSSKDHPSWGRNHSAETRKKISDALKGKPGHKHSKEHREKLSINNPDYSI